MNPDEGVRGTLLLDFRNRAALANLYRESSMLTFEVQKIQSSQNIVAKLTSLPFQQCKHAITTVDGNLQLASEQHALRFSQMPGRNRYVEFGNFQTSGVSILVHSVLYFALMCIFLLAIGVHMYLGS